MNASAERVAFLRDYPERASIADVRMLLALLGTVDANLARDLATLNAAHTKLKAAARRVFDPALKYAWRIVSDDAAVAFRELQRLAEVPDAPVSSAPAIPMPGHCESLASADFRWASDGKPVKVPVIVLVPDSQEGDESRERLALKNLVRAAVHAERELSARIGIMAAAAATDVLVQLRKAVAEGRAALEPVMCGDGI